MRLQISKKNFDFIYELLCMIDGNSGLRKYLEERNMGEKLHYLKIKFYNKSPMKKGVDEYVKKWEEKHGEPFCVN